MILQVLNENSNFFGYGNINVQATNRGYDGEAGCYRILTESEQEWGKLTLAMANAEVAAFLNEDAVLLEAAGAGFLEKAKNFFLKLWAKVKELFNKFVAFIKTHTMNDEKFLKKYEKQINLLQSRVSNKFKYKMIPWKWKSIVDTAEKGTDAMIIAMDVLSIANDEIINIFNNTARQKYVSRVDNEYRYNKDNFSSDKKTHMTDTIRGLFLSGSAINNFSDLDKASAIESEDFREEILKKCCGGEDPDAEEKDGDEIEWNDLIDIVRNGKKTIETMEKSKKNMDILFSKIIKQMDKQLTQVSKVRHDNINGQKISVGYSASGDWKTKNKSDARLLNKTYVQNDEIDAEFGKNHNFSYKNQKNQWKDKDKKNFTDNKNDAIGYMSTFVNTAKEVSSIATQGYSICIEAAKKCRVQARGILNKGVVATSSGAMASESVSYNNILDMFM